jgi:hypothetical protein
MKGSRGEINSHGIMIRFDTIARLDKPLEVKYYVNPGF